MKLSARLVNPLAVFVERYYPDPFVFVVLLSALTFVLVITLTGRSPTEALADWGDGLPKLLAFTAQLSITLIVAHALAHTAAAQTLLKRVGNLPASATAAYATVAFSAGIGSLLAWSLGLVVGATVARQVAIECARRKIAVHYPLLVASAYAGFVVWHMGYSSSAGLFVATPGHSLEAEMGILPITETIFSLQNGLLALLTLLAITVVCPLMRPQPGEIIEIDPRCLEEELGAPASAASTPAQKLESARSLSSLLGAALLAYIGHRLYVQGFHLTLDIVNWSFLGLCLVLASSPLHFVRLIQGAGGAVGPIIIQYPFYAGILGMMSASGLVDMISNGFASVASADTLGVYAFLSAGLVNMFVPSGGAQWAIQGPVFIDAARTLGVADPVIVLAVAYGDQWTNMIQPFWTIPLLAIAGLHMRQIMGYTFVILLVTLVIFGGGLLLMGAGN